ncbi:MAG TPA: hypothetical protein VEI03_05130 [Stellaceae bacterium]|nr:hypothetical protein [Stellaceae bacterium]
MTKPWFKTRRYGWGWTPASIEGWVVVAVFLALTLSGTAIFLHALRAGASPPLACLLFVLWTAVLGGVLTAVAWAKGEPPRWRWGD